MIQPHASASSIITKVLSQGFRVVFKELLLLMPPMPPLPECVRPGVARLLPPSAAAADEDDDEEEEVAPVDGRNRTID
jgi:hypothetical protein